jgi:uncharacterized membrane protein HdeD (DUF308 family)
MQHALTLTVYLAGTTAILVGLLRLGEEWQVRAKDAPIFHLLVVGQLLVNTTFVVGSFIVYVQAILDTFEADIGELYWFALLLLPLAWYAVVADVYYRVRKRRTVKT